MKKTILSRVFSPAVASACLLTAGTAIAASESFSVEVPVVGVEPIVRTVTDKIPHQSCWDERVRIERRGGSHAAVPTVLGAIIGGVAGGAIGNDSRHQPVIAGAGAALGAAIGHDVSHQRDKRYRYVTEQRCEIDYELREREETIGYRVAYQYGDTIYHTRKQYHPGNTIRVNVTLSPDNFRR